MPKFSVVTVCFNAECTIENTIISVISQKFRDFEYLVIDGVSNDGTLEILKKYGNEIDVLVSEPDTGIYNAMNKAANIASGEYIIYMNANDVFFDESILDKVSSSIKNNEYSLVYGDYFLMLNEERYFIRAKKKSKGKIITSHQAIFCRRNLVAEIKFDESLKLAADYKLVNDLLHIGESYYLNFPVCVMEGVGFSSNKKSQILREYFSINKKLFGIVFSSYIFSLAWLSMQVSNFLTMIGLVNLRSYLRKFKGWRVSN